MALSVVMPALEMAQETGKLLSWRKHEGERVTKGEPLLEVETDKAVVEIESPGDGILAGVRAQEGDVVPVGQTIAWLVQAGEVPPSDVAPSQSGRRADGGAARQAVGVATPPEQTGATGIRISPKARRLAREHGVDISGMRGSGPGGEILAEDILARAGSEVGAASSSTDLEPLSSIGRLMAERTTQSWTTVPHFFVVREVDAGALVAAQQKLEPAIEKARGVKLTFTDLLVALVARVLPRHPRLNASWTADGIRLHREVKVGIAVAVSAGVVVAAIHRADTTSLDEVAVQRREVAERARMGRLQPSDIAGATFTISNLGMLHVDAFTAIIVPPQAGILAVGAIAKRVVPVDGDPGIGIRPMMTVTLSCDHRVVDGARGAAFLNDVVEAIREPEKWLGRTGGE
jgi:pyruvate dehydrogenase E2 component (dihydrolipoyllysine-residue acetyltransferase)